MASQVAGWGVARLAGQIFVLTRVARSALVISLTLPVLILVLLSGGGCRRRRRLMLHSLRVFLLNGRQGTIQLA